MRWISFLPEIITTAKLSIDLQPLVVFEFPP